MSNRTVRMAAAVAATLSLSAVAWSQTPEQRIAQLEEKIATLEARQAASSKDLAATIDSVLRDAERRSQLLANGADSGAGYDNGFFIRGGAWELRPSALFQFRHVLNYRDNVSGDDSTFENGFEVSRMQFGLSGTAFTKDLEFAIDWNSSTDDGSLVLEDAFAKYMFADAWGVRMGQFRVPISHEWLIGEGTQLAVDRSMVDNLIGGAFAGRTQGVSLVYGNYAKNNPVNAEVVLHDGAGEDNTNFVDASFDWGVAARLEFKAMGDWKNYGDLTAKGTKDDLLVFGIGGDWSQSGDDNLFLAALDAQFEMANGLGLYGAALMRSIDTEIVDSTDWGFLVQAGFMLNPSWEIFGRYNGIWYDEDYSGDDFHELTAGVNYYMGKDGSAGHRAKFTVDLGYLPNGAPRALSNLGILDNNGDEDEWILRAQFQLWI